MTERDIATALEDAQEKLRIRGAECAVLSLDFLEKRIKDLGFPAPSGSIEVTAGRPCELGDDQGALPHKRSYQIDRTRCWRALRKRSILLRYATTTSSELIGSWNEDRLHVWISGNGSQHCPNGFLPLFLEWLMHGRKRRV